RNKEAALTCLNLLGFPAASFEKDDPGGGDGGLRDNDRPENATGTHVDADGEKIGEGYLQEPETEEMHDGRCDGVASAVEGLEHDHAVGIGDVAVTQNAQAGDGKRDDERIVGKETNDRLGKDDEKDADDAEKEHVVKAGAPHGNFRALGLLGAKVLSDQRGGGVAEAPTGHQHEDEYANGDGVASERCRAEDADDADEADPTGVRDGKLQDAGQRDAQEAEQDAEVDMKLAAENADALRAAEKAVELIKHADASAGESGEGRAGDAQLWEWSPAKDEARVENEIDDVGDPEQTHGDGGVTCAAEDGVVEK